MPARKYVRPDEKVGLNLTAAERKTILKDVEFLDDDYEQALRETPVGQAIEFTLSDWDYLWGTSAVRTKKTRTFPMEATVHSALGGRASNGAEPSGEVAQAVCQSPQTV